MVEIRLPWRKGEGVHVYSEKERMIRLIIMVLGPFYAIWTAFTILYYIKEYTGSVMLLVCGGVAWIAGIVILMNQRQMEAGQFQCFRGATWRMSTTQRIKADIYVDAEGKDLGEIGGYHVYKPHFPFALYFKHPTLNEGKGVIFDKAFWLCPDKWKETFFQIPQQEAWFGSLPVSVEAEDVTLHNLRWIIKKNTKENKNSLEYIPVALVTDSNLHFEATLGKVQLNEDKRAVEIAKWMCENADLVTENMDLALEVVAEAKGNQALLENTDDIVRLKKEAMEDAKKRHGDISRVPGESRWQKINWRLMLVSVIVLSIITLIAITLLRFW